MLPWNPANHGNFGMNPAPVGQEGDIERLEHLCRQIIFRELSNKKVKYEHRSQK